MSPETPIFASSAARTAGRVCQPLIPGRLPDAAVQAAERIHRALLPGLETDLTRLLRQPATVRLRKTVQAPPREILPSAETHAHTVAIDLGNARSRVYMVFPTDLLFRMLDILLATPSIAPASAESGGQPEMSLRAVTAIELYILQECFEVFANSLREAWQPFCPAPFQILPPAEDGDAAAPGDGEPPALTLRTTVELSGAGSEVDIVIPAFLARLVEMKTNSGRETDKPGSRIVLAALDNAFARFDAVLGGASLRIRDLMNLMPGQILSLGYPEGHAIDGRVNGTLLFSGELIAGATRRGIQIAGLAGAGSADGSGASTAEER